MGGEGIVQSLSENRSFRNVDAFLDKQQTMINVEFNMKGYKYSKSAKGMQRNKTDARGSCRFKPDGFNTVEEKELSCHHSW